MPLDAENSPSVVAINVSPIEYGHFLMIPRVLDCLPQRIDLKSLLLALHMAAEAANPYFRLGYNSLGAFATIKHLHFQAYYLPMPFPLEKAHSKKMITTVNGVKISELLNYPNNNIPFNILISDCGRQIFLMPHVYNGLHSKVKEAVIALINTDSAKGYKSRGLTLILPKDTSHKSMKSPVGTHCVGLAYNLASFLLSDGEKGQRFAMQLSRIALKSPAGAPHGQADDIQNEAKDLSEDSSMK